MQCRIIMQKIKKVLKIRNIYFKRSLFILKIICNYGAPAKKILLPAVLGVLCVFTVSFPVFAAGYAADPALTEAAPPAEKHAAKKPFRVSGLKASVREGNIVVEWNDTSDDDVAGYNLYYKKNGDAGFRKLNRKLLTENSATLSGLKVKVRYFFMATSVSGDGVESDYSEITSEELPEGE
jgi:hypothetical protein